ncbi:hypothetical protein, partial [Planktothrix sp. FACHB-1365]|uniref:hypothetical protein n=1 Tax=Planktothrix sp. FACHB-1365 TaxID=2692855 RepID=UPI0016851814
KVYSDGDGSGAISLEKITPDKYSEVQPVEIPQTEPENPPPSNTPNPKSSDKEKDVEFVKRYLNGEKLTEKEKLVVSLTANIVRYQICTYKTKEAFLREWQKLTLPLVHKAQLVLGCCKDGEKFFTKFLPGLGITPTELGLSDPTPKPTKPDGDQISLFD